MMVSSSKIIGFPASPSPVAVSFLAILLGVIAGVEAGRILTS